MARSALRSDDAAAVFAALGDDTRLALVKSLGDGTARTATELAADLPITRQAVVKHLRVLEGAGLVVNERRGREVLYVLDGGRVDEARAFLDAVSARWDRAIARLRTLVEED